MSIKVRRSTLLPLILLIYLAVMSYIGRGEFYAGNYTYYFGIIAVTLLCIVLLHFFLRRKEKLRAERERDINTRKPSHTDND